MAIILIEQSMTMKSPPKRNRATLQTNCIFPGHIDLHEDLTFFLTWKNLDADDELKAVREHSIELVNQRTRFRIFEVLV
jgi:hypothetical protein